MNLYQRILKVMTAVPYIQKDAKVAAGGGGYSAVTHDAVIGYLRPHMIEAGIVLSVDQTAESSVEGQTAKGFPKIRYEGWYTVSLINAEDPSERHDYHVHAHAEDSGDKAPGKAMSYATKSALLKAFALETGESDESRYQPHEQMLITDEQHEELESIIGETNADRERLLAFFKIDSLKQLPRTKYAKAKNLLIKKT